MSVTLSPHVDVSDLPIIWNDDLIIDTSDKILVSDKDFITFQWVVVTVICQSINTFGIVTNIINIVCFTNQGFMDPVNVSLMGLAISDMCSLVTIFWSNICITPAVAVADLPFDPVGTQYLISGIPHTTFARISGWITSLITLERCLCITMPLKVKDIITPQRVSVIITCIFVLHIVSIAPLYIVCRLEMAWIPERNTTILGLTFTENRESFEKASFVVNNAFLSFTAFFIIITCTGILVVKLRSKTKWREKSTASGQADILSNRNMRVAKMVVIISLLFIICFVPICISFLAMALVPGLSIDGVHKNLLFIVGSLGFFLESINSSVNIFVYYYMSSKYKTAFHTLFSLVKSKKT